MMHVAAYQFVSRVVRAKPFTHLGPMVEIGGRDINGSVRPLLEPWATTYTSLDLYPGPGVDLVIDAVRYTPATPLMCVVCCEVLEHAPNAADSCRWAHHVLADGGVFIVTAAETS